MRYFLLAIWASLCTVSSANYPVFDGANLLKELFIPADVHIGSAIYRLRASDSDHDYPLQFDATDYGSYVVRVENLACTVNSTYCEANVYLDRVLMAGQAFKFRFTVRDTKGDTTTAPASIQVTNAPVDITTIFPHLPGIIILPESTKVGTELEYVIVRRHPEHTKTTLLEIRGSLVVDFSKIRTSQETVTGVITLKKNLDFEQQNMYKLQIFALDMYTDKRVDSRNIAGFEIILIVEDVQDSPPIFIQLETIIKLRSNLTQGDVITKITAIDGDKGNPRKIKYGLVSENNPFTVFFNVDRITGEITLIRPLKQLTAIARSYQPILLTILAEEEKINSKDTSPSMSSTATIVLLLAEVGNTPPYFDNDHYVSYLNENSPQGTALNFSEAYNTQVHDDDMGKQGVFSLTVEQNNGTFEITPNVVERNAYFTIRVRNKSMLDYEAREYVHFTIVAKELDPGSLSSSVTVLVYLNDVNDNPPKFLSPLYTAQIAENATANTVVAEVKAVDVDTGAAGRVHYTKIHGFRNNSLLLNSVTGVINLASDNHGFDREESAEYRLAIEARDMEGSGLLATVPLVISILDVNDETPTFQNAPFHFTLTPDSKNFSTRAFVKAIDKDAEPPNNIVRYEIMSGNYNNKFVLNQETGELTVAYTQESNGLKKRRQIFNSPSVANTPNVYLLTVRAYDLGVPHRSSVAQIRIYPPDAGTRQLNFILPKTIDYQLMEEVLNKITGGRVTILDVKPYQSRYNRELMDTTARTSKEKSTVIARVTYGDNSMVDVEQVYNLLQNVFLVEPNNADKIEIHTAESGKPLFSTLLIILLVVIIILISLLLYYFWKCFPTIQNSKNKKDSRVSPDSRTINHNNKGTQATNNRQDSRTSADSTRQNRNWKFYHRSREPEPQSVLLIPKNISPMRYQNVSTVDDKLPPTFVYRTETNKIEQHGDLLIQDIADTEYRILDPSKLNMHRLNDRIHTRTRKYEHRRITSPSIRKREEKFVREGDAEILRLQTNDEQSVINHIGQRLLPNHEIFDTDSIDDPISDNTVATATNQLRSLSPVFRQTNVPETSFIVDDHSRFPPNFDNLNDLSKTNAQNEFEPEIDDKQRDNKLPNGFARDLLSNAPAAAAAAPSLPQHQSNQPEPIEAASQTSEPIGDDTKNHRRSSITNLEEERNRLTSLQRDLLLTRLLVEEQRRYLNYAGDTLSLPGSLSMATQTDRNRGTQTDTLQSMRPEPRKVKSENDDSSDSDGNVRDNRIRMTTVAGERIAFVTEDGKRHKIRTPIIEESESTEALRNSGGVFVTVKDKRRRRDETAVEKKSNNKRLLLQRLKYMSTNDVDRIGGGGGGGGGSVKTQRSIYLKHGKKAISVTNLEDARCVLSDKEVYTPRSLKSRMIARRLTSIDARKLAGQQSDADTQKTYETDSYAAKRYEKLKKTDRQKMAEIFKNTDTDSPESAAVVNGTGAVHGRTRNDEDDDGDIETIAQNNTTLKLKSKNQQLMEKKSVFTIAYDDATTGHLGESSNGSTHE